MRFCTVATLLLLASALFGQMVVPSPAAFPVVTTITAPVPFAPPPGGVVLLADTVFAGVQAANLAGLDQNYAVINQLLLNSAAGQCANWTSANLTLRAQGSPLYPTPQPAPAHLWAYSIEPNPTTGDVWVLPPTQTGASTPACPALAAVSTSTDVGASLGTYAGITYYACPADDTNAANTIITVTPGETFKSGAQIPSGTVLQKTFVLFGYYWESPPSAPTQ
jgi:hypothetical protein